MNWRLPTCILITFVLMTAGASLAGREFTSALSSGDGTKVLSMSSFLVQPDDWGLAAERADVVALGTITELGSARWVTQDGNTPEKIDNRFGSSVQIRTPVYFRVEQAFKGTMEGDVIRFSFMGGTVGDIRVESDQFEAISSGARAIVFLYSNPSSFVTNATGTSLFPGFVLIVEGETVHGPLYDIEFTDLISQVEKGGQK